MTLTARTTKYHVCDAPDCDEHVEAVLDDNDKTNLATVAGWHIGWVHMNCTVERDYCPTHKDEHVIWYAKNDHGYGTTNDVRIVAQLNADTKAHAMRQVDAYLPTNYRASTAWLPHGSAHWHVEIIGHDYAGWTAEGYVIPRLGSGSIGASVEPF